MRNRMNECNTVNDLKRKQGNMKACFFLFISCFLTINILSNVLLC